MVLLQQQRRTAAARPRSRPTRSPWSGRCRHTVQRLVRRHDANGVTPLDGIRQRLGDDAAVTGVEALDRVALKDSATAGTWLPPERARETRSQPPRRHAARRRPVGRERLDG